MKSLSIISNVIPCEKNCWYCVWKDHPLRSCSGPTDTKKMFAVMAKATKISLSGGGDPADDWLLCQQVLQNSPVQVDLHTSKFNLSQSFYNQFNKCVFHFQPSDLFDYNLVCFLSELKCKIRVNLVMTWQINFMDVYEISYLLLGKGFEVGFRELYHKELSFKCHPNKIRDVLKLKKIFGTVKYIEQGDYNLYYMPDDKIYSNYFLKGGEYEI